MKRLIPLLLLPIFFSGCSKRLPKGIMPKENMISILTDIHLVDGYANSLPSDSVNTKTSLLYQAVFRKHHTDKNQFKKSLAYYSERPEELKNMYVQVTKNLEQLHKKEQKKEEDKRKKEEEKRKKEEKARLDSLKQDSLKKAEAKRKDEIQKKFNEKKIMKKDSVKTKEIKKRNDLSGERKR